MTGGIRWSIIAALIVVIVVAPILYFRYVYDTYKRLRVVEPGRVYRSGQMTAEGFADAIERYGLRTIINVQDDFPDPDIDISFWNRETMKESELCRQMGVRYVHLMPTLLPRRLAAQQRPPVIDNLLSILDDKSNYPVLLHCHAGLHRTGILTAIYRMEYQSWSPTQAFLDMKAQGFGPWVCTSANDYVKQFVLTYKPGIRAGQAMLNPSRARSAAE